MEEKDERVGLETGAHCDDLQPTPSLIAHLHAANAPTAMVKTAGLSTVVPRPGPAEGGTVWVRIPRRSCCHGRLLARGASVGGVDSGACAARRASRAKIPEPGVAAVLLPAVRLSWRVLGSHAGRRRAVVCSSGLVEVRAAVARLTGCCGPGRRRQLLRIASHRSAQPAIGRAI